MPWVLRGRQGRGPNQEHRESGGQGVIGGNLLGVAPDFYETWGWAVLRAAVRVGAVAWRLSFSDGLIWCSQTILPPPPHCRWWCGAPAVIWGAD